jgi:RNA polymerase sigma-70 factor (ECF subfamily)
MEDMKQHEFMKLFLNHQSVVTGYLLACTGDLTKAEEIFQDVSLVLWEKFDTYDPSKSFKAWALGVARLEVLKSHQQFARSKEILSEDAVEKLAHAAAEVSENISAVNKYLDICLEKIRNTMKNVIEMKYRQELSIANIAKKIGKKTGAVEMILVRARRFLRKCIDQHMGEGKEVIS